MNECKLHICGSCDNADCNKFGMTCGILSNNYDVFNDTCSDYKPMIYEKDEEYINEFGNCLDYEKGNEE